MDKMTLKDVELKDKSLLMRVDFNVPIENGNISDDNRIRQALQSINYATEQGAKLILMSHLGRPGGQRDDSLSLKPVADYLQNEVDTSVHFAGDCIGDKAKSVIEQTRPGEIVLLENTRFHEGEKANNEDFCKQLAAHGDLYCNDAFGSSHRAHASVSGVAEFLKPALSGFLLEKEIEYFSGVVNNPNPPFVAILGGAKVSDKIEVIKNLIPKVDTILIGGGMTYTFFHARALPVGNSLVEEEKVSLASDLMKQAQDEGVKFLLPMDSVIAKELDNDAEHKVVGKAGIEDDWMGVDIGPQTILSFGNIIRNANTVVWNGPMGVFEMPNFADGTHAVAEALADATKEGATTIIGGGDSASAIQQAGYAEQVSHISTGGGASLMYLEGKELPSVAALSDKKT